MGESGGGGWGGSGTGVGLGLVVDGSNGEGGRLERGSEGSVPEINEGGGGLGLEEVLDLGDVLDGGTGIGRLGGTDEIDDTGIGSGERTGGIYDESTPCRLESEIASERESGGLVAFWEILFATENPGTGGDEGEIGGSGICEDDGWDSEDVDDTAGRDFCHDTIVVPFDVGNRIGGSECLGDKWEWIVVGESWRSSLIDGGELVFFGGIEERIGVFGG